ncbi:ABC-F family ATP-binding cassette domain-containing protein [Planctomycetota bacterium]
MIVLQAKNLSKHFGPRVLFENVNFQLDAGRRVGLIGKNGSGKSTLLRIILDKESPDAGEVSIHRGITVNYLRQHVAVREDLTLREEVASVFQAVEKMERQLEALTDKISRAGEDQQEDLLRQYNRLLEEFESQGAYQWRQQLEKVLAGLGFPRADWDRPVSKLSGGQKSRAALAKMILSRPQLLILDEPTNYLDLWTTEWLEDYLASYSGSVVVVSHDRFFLDKIATDIWELERGKLHCFKGNYSVSRAQRKLFRDDHQKQYEKQQLFIHKEEEFIRRHMAGQRVKEAKGRRKRLDRLERLEDWQEDRLKMKMAFVPKRREAATVLECQDLCVSYPQKPIVQNLNLEVRRGDRICIIGPNGAGKSSLLKTFIGKIKFDSGKLKWGQNLDIGYFDQEMKLLHPNRTLYQEIDGETWGWTKENIKAFLGRFQFTGDDSDKMIRDLSGGERACALLSKIILQCPNVLILDEPVNHLDLKSREHLEETIKAYQGTVLIVSHDRFLLNAVAGKVLYIDNNRAKLYRGNYDNFKEKFNPQDWQIIDKKASVNRQQREQLRKEKKQLQKEVVKIEKSIQQLEDILTENRAILETPEVYMDAEKGRTLAGNIKNLEVELIGLYQKWEDLSESNSANQ